MGRAEAVDMLLDKDAIQEAFESKLDPLIEYPGALGRFFGDALERDGFVSFMGPEKRGKSFWLLDVAWRAALQRKKVAWFEAGDMSKNQVIRRFMVRVSERPLKPTTVEFPLEIVELDDGRRKVKIQSRRYKTGLNPQRARAAITKIVRSKFRSKTSFLKLSAHPAGTLSVNSIRDIMRRWEREESWVPDVVVVDYADLLAPVNGRLDTRDQINDSWQRLRALSQEFHVLVVTATQSDASSYTAKTLSMKHFSNDKRKFAHVTGMVGLNATAGEKGLMRLNWLAGREFSYDSSKCVYVAECRDLANPAVRSAF